MEQNQEISIFKNEEFGEVRTVIIDSEPWFVGKDVAVALGYTNPQKAVRDHVDEEDRTVNDSFTVNGTMATLINESGIYSLVISSKIPNARKFKRWVTSEVIPSIRKTGTYGLSAIDTATLRVLHATDPMEKALALADFRDAIAAPLQAVIEEQKPKVTYYDVVMQSDDVVPITVIAKDYGLSARKLNSMLKEWGVQYKQGQQWFLYAKYAGCGYMHSVTTAVDNGHVFMNSQWTQKGRKFIYDIMKENGYLPLIEKEEIA